MKEASSSQEILALEKKFWDAMKDRDSATAVSLSDDTCVVVGPQGVGEIDRATLARMMDTGNSRLNGFSFDDVHVRQVADDVMVLAYKVREDVEVDGEDIDLQAFESSVWVRRDGHWLCAAHTESLAGDPYGRH